jgi:two-component system cell cycle sensor histidine kinase/response regulator CckA
MPAAASGWCKTVFSVPYPMGRWGTALFAAALTLIGLSLFTFSTSHWLGVGFLLGLILFGAAARIIRRSHLRSSLGNGLAAVARSDRNSDRAIMRAPTAPKGHVARLVLDQADGDEEHLNEQFGHATRMQAIGQLAGGVAHDFNNVLTGILGQCDLMLMRHAPGDIDYDDIQQIKNNANRAAALTRQLLAFSRQQTLRPQILQLPDIVAEISNLLARLMGEKIDLIVKHGRNLGPIWADPGQLEQVIVNLAVNARDAMPEGGKLIIQTYAVTAADVRASGNRFLPIADYAALSVTDTGGGIDPDLMPKIFDPFFTTKDVGKGTGLGLSTVYGIVKQSGGHLFADSTPGQGSSFVIYLPVHKGAEVHGPMEDRGKTQHADLWGHGTILLVEDEDMVRAIAERALTLQGYKVLCAAAGEEGLALLDKHRDIELLVTDVVMPSMDGPTLGKLARAKRPGLPIIFMSGYAEESLRQEIALENVNFLPKPFSVQQLAEVVKKALIA